MIKEEYVSLDTAKLLKEAGFPQDENVVYKRDRELDVRGYVDDDRIVAAAPTQAQAMRWLREEKHLLILIWLGFVPGYAYIVAYMRNGLPVLHDEGSTVCVGEDDLFDSYEAAAEAGIQAACEYLIKKKN